MGYLQFFSCMHFLEGDHVNPQQRLLKASCEVQKMSVFCGDWLLVGDLGLHQTGSEMVADAKALLLETNCSLLLDNQTPKSCWELFKVYVEVSVFEQGKFSRLIRNYRNIVLKVSQLVIKQVAASGGPLRGPSGWIVRKKSSVI